MAIEHAWTSYPLALAPVAQFTPSATLPNPFEKLLAVVPHDGAQTNSTGEVVLVVEVALVDVVVTPVLDVVEVEVAVVDVVLTPVFDVVEVELEVVEEVEVTTCPQAASPTGGAYSQASQRSLATNVAPPAPPLLAAPISAASSVASVLLQKPPSSPSLSGPAA